MNYEQAYKIVHENCVKNCADASALLIRGDFNNVYYSRFRELIEPRFYDRHFVHAVKVVINDRVKPEHRLMDYLYSRVHIVVNDGLEYTIQWMTGEVEDGEPVWDQLRDKLPHVCIT